MNLSPFTKDFRGQEQLQWVLTDFFSAVDSLLTSAAYNNLILSNTKGLFNNYISYILFLSTIFVSTFQSPNNYISYRNMYFFPLYLCPLFKAQIIIFHTEICISFHFVCVHCSNYYYFICYFYFVGHLLVAEWAIKLLSTSKSNK